MSLYHAAVVQNVKMLRNLGRWLDDAEAYAKEREFDPEVLLQARLYPDQFALLRQVQSACDSAKLAAHRLAGKDAPKHEDTETTLAELRARIDSAASSVEKLTEADFGGAAERVIKLPFLPEGKVISGANYFDEFGQPNFYFHVCMSYAILRHNGVKLGKRPYIGGMTLDDA
ncbi:MAG: DUF1993 family protein [Sandaracinaceae bacterium]